MRLTILRHAPAMDRTDWTGPDHDRPLTSDGRRKGREACRCYAPLIRATAILTSPWTRAAQTADLAAAAWKLPVEAVPWLAGEDIDPATALGEASRHEAVVLVGHEPGLGILVGHCLGAPPQPLTKAGLAILDGEPTAGGMRLVGFWSRKQARDLAR